MAILRPFASTPASGGKPESEERFRATLEQAAIGVAHQTLDDKWVWMNQRWCEIVGFSKEELLSRNLSGLTHPNDREASAEFDRKVRGGQLDRYSIEKRYPSASTPSSDSLRSTPSPAYSATRPMPPTSRAASSKRSAAR